MSVSDESVRPAANGVPEPNGRTAFVTGITGQDGSYLAEYLLGLGYTVHGLVRRASGSNTARIDHLLARPELPLILHDGDLTDGAALVAAVRGAVPDEVYNLAGQSHVRVSFDSPLYTADATGLGALRVLEACRQVADLKPVRFFQASTSEMYGRVMEGSQDESTPFHPRSPYACAKAFAFHQTVNYRESYGLHAVNGILFNHESPRRGETFVTRKITRAAARIAEGLQSTLALGNLDAKRDWGYAKEYAAAMHTILSADRRTTT